MGENRSKQSLSLKRKVEIIKSFEQAPPMKKKKEIAEEFGIPPNTLSNILKNRKKIMESLDQQKIDPERSRFRTAKYPDIEEALFLWFKNVRDKNLPVSGPL